MWIVADTSVLYRLQQIDSKSDGKRARLDEINALLGENEGVQAARQRLEQTEERTRTAQARTTELELNIASLQDKAKATSDRLYSGVVKNPKEMQDMEHELQSLARRQGELEDLLLEAMMTLEESQSQRGRARAELQSTEEEWAANQGDLAAEKQALEADLRELEAQREGVAGQADANALAAYESLRARLGGLAVARLQNEVCGACGVVPTSTVIQKARHNQLDARCPTCGRILIAV
jgi:predicted  nucleic acid-binding Zn-ribbon protein